MAAKYVRASPSRSIYTNVNVADCLDVSSDRSDQKQRFHTSTEKQDSSLVL